MTIGHIKTMTRAFLSNTFDHFEFLADLGLPTLRRVGDAYFRVLDTIKDKDEYVELTGSLLVYITRMQRWIHLIFPWHLGKHFPHRSTDAIVGLPKLPTYSESAVWSTFHSRCCTCPFVEFYGLLMCSSYEPCFRPLSA